MARKRTRVVGGSVDSTDSPEKYETKGNCPHTLKGVDMSGLKKAWKKREDLNCQGCKRKQHVNTQKNAGVDLWVCMFCGHIGCGITHFNHANEHYNTLHSDCHSVMAIVDSWTVRCLQCRIDINLDTNEKAAHAIAFLKKNFLEPVKEEKANNKDVTTPTTSEKKSTVHEAKAKVGIILSRHAAPILGLENIGNTCYMNSILQCLAQTPDFVCTLQSCCHSGISYRLAGGENLISKEYGDLLPPLEGMLGEGGQLSKAVYRVLNKVKSGEEFRKSGINTENPADVLRIMKKISNTFYTGEQHDSHELLRLLLEGLKTEDLKRYQRGILNAMKICSADKEVLPKEREFLVAYKKQVMLNELMIDNIFGGSIVSILKCLECGQVTTTFESFMDISLPVDSEKVKGFERITVAPEPRLSKHQQKKERKLAKRVKKKLKLPRVQVDTNPQDEVPKSNSSNESASESEADVEDNLDSENATSGALVDSVSRPDNDIDSDKLVTSQVVEEVNNGDSSDVCQKVYPFSTLIYGLMNEAASRPEPDATVYDCIPEPKIPEDIGNQEQSLTVSSSNPEILTVIYGCSPEPPTVTDGGSPEASFNEDFGSCEGGRGSPASSIEQADWEEVNCRTEYSVLAQGVVKALQLSQEQESVGVPPPEPFDGSTSDTFKEEDLSLPIGSGDDSELLLENVHTQYAPFSSDTSLGEGLHLNTYDREVSDGNHTLVSKHDASDETFDTLMEVQIESNNKKENDNQCSEETECSESSGSVWGTTLAGLPQLDSKTYCLEHCLQQFFSEEILSGANKIGCTQCTNRKGGNEPKPNSKLIQANAIKQLLFLKLPQVLTIHLKRFEVLGSRMSKINRKVTFPMELDVSPYTSSRAECKQAGSPPLYHLYGVVEHSGHMSSGHYVAYVKVNQEPSGKKNNVEGVQSPEKQSVTACKDSNSDEVKKAEEIDSKSNVITSKWYFISDTLVKEVSVKEVSNAEAYILFYRRI